MQQTVRKDTSICLDSGGKLVELDYLRNMGVPEPKGPRHHPIRFDLFADMVNHRIRRIFPDYEVYKTHYALNNKETQFFGLTVMLVPGWDDEMGLLIGYRGSIDQSLSESLVVGANVFICDNLCLSGGKDGIFVFRKNTLNAMNPSHPTSLGNQILTALYRADSLTGNLHRDIDMFKDTRISQRRMAELTGVAMYEDVLKPTQANEVYRQIREPSHEVFESATMWSLYNHMTEGAKLGSLARTFETHGNVHEFCKREAIDNRPTLVAVA